MDGTAIATRTVTGGAVGSPRPPPRRHAEDDHVEQDPYRVHDDGAWMVAVVQPADVGDGDVEESVESPST